MLCRVAMWECVQNPDIMFKYRIYVYFGTQTITEDHAVANSFSTRGLDNISAELDYMLGAGLLLNTSLSGLRFGAFSYIQKDWSIDGESAGGSPFLPTAGTPLNFYTDKLTSLKLAVEYTIEDWVFASEWGTFKGDWFSGSTAIFQQNQESWYVQASYRINEKWEVASYYSEFYHDADDKNGAGFANAHDAYHKDTDFSVRYDASEFWTLKVEVHYIDGTAVGKSPDSDPTEPHWLMFAFKTTVTF